MTTPTYIYEDTEVTLTGREATRSKGTNTQARRITNATPPEVKVEITPADRSTGSWKKWINKDDLFIVIDNGR